ncbi:hypothetical protein NC652_027693 [Populus alba x Populus x berolinensis]|nr:hypothetical protein NC652_027693 [Populus alba x Populus x berolinensis]
MAFSAGANNLTDPFSKPEGLSNACLIYVPGAALTSKSTVDSLFYDAFSYRKSTRCRIFDVEPDSCSNHCRTEFSFLCQKELCNAPPNCKSDKRSRSTDHQYIEIPDKTSSTKEEDKKHDGVEEMLTDFMQRRVLEAAYISRGGGKELRITKIFR